VTVASLSIKSRSDLVMPPQATSIRLGRHAVRAWLQCAPYRYDDDTVLLLLTELIISAIDHTRHPLMLSVFTEGDRMRVELADDGGVDATDPPAPDFAWVTEEERHLQMISALAARWGEELRVADKGQTRVIWFECEPLGTPVSRERGAPSHR
jgi:hypothetical protein